MRSTIWTALLLIGCGAAPTPLADGLDTAVAANARQLFQRYDLNQDGQLSPLEAQQLSIFGDAFKGLDANGDGQLSWAEFATPARLAHLADSFRGVATNLLQDEDADGDGRLSRAEYANGMLAPVPGPGVASPLPDPVGQSFDRADADHDGYLTRQEAAGLIGYLLGAGYRLQQRLK